MLPIALPRRLWTAARATGDPRPPRPAGLRRWLALLAAALLLPPLLVAYVAFATGGQRFADPAHVPPARVALVFGAGVRPDGTPTPMLADRVRAAAALHRAGRVDKLLMSGDNSRPEYNEVAAMRRYALALGVPAADITLDYAGFSTYDSCYRAGAIFGVEQAVLVTQQFHLARAVYTCRQLGVQAVGLGTADWGVYGQPLMLVYTLRESLATLNALWEVHIAHPKPKFLGPLEPIP